MKYADKIDEILKKPNEFFTNFPLRFNNEEDFSKKADQYREALKVMEETLVQLEELEPDIFNKEKHNIIKESFKKNTDNIRQIVDIVNNDPMNMASSKVSDLIKQMGF